MIPPRIVRAFLERELDDCRPIKELNKKALDAEISALSPRPEFHTKPYRHQLVAFLLGLSYPRFLFFLDMGLGKTKVVLDLLRYYRQCGKMKRALILVPNVANLAEWKTQVGIHQPRFTVEQLEPGDYIKSGADISVCNYQRLCHLLGCKVGRKLFPDDGAICDFASNYDAVILDESTAVKNHMSLTYRIVNKLTHRMGVVYALTGTPFGREPADLWAQFRVVDKGATLGKTIGLFRSAFCRRVKSHWGGGFEYPFKESMREDLNRIIQHRSVQYNTEDCIDLPDKVFTKINIDLGAEGRTIYNEFLSALRAEVIEGHTVESCFARLRQAASGFTVVDNNGDKVNVLIEDSQGKTDAVVRVMENTPPNSKVVIFHEFIYSGEVISKRLTSLKISHSRLWSGTKDRESEIRKFLKDPKCRAFVVNNQSGAFGLNLQVANYVLYYESPVSPIVRAQTEKRCHRVGQTKRVFYYDLASRGTVDWKILSFLRQGKDLRKAILRGDEVL